MRRYIKRIGWALTGILWAVVLVSGCGMEAESVTRAPTLEPSPTEDELSTLIAMQQAATEVPTASPWPTHTPTRTPTVTPPPTSTHTPEPTVMTSPTAYPTNTPRSTQVIINETLPATPAPLNQIVEPQDHYWFARPFPRDPSNRVLDYASRSYPYGSTGGGQFATHHGVDIQNPVGTSILAVANGWVVYAGDDLEQMFGPQHDFYGYLVVIEHDFVAPNGQMLYSLYGHMSRVDVEIGQHVNQQEKIGEVGATGVALGAHLHFEVRIGDAADYGSTYNPDLWLRPWPTFGTLAGRVTDREGNPVHDVTITLGSDGGPDRYASSYADDTVNSDLYYGENYTRGDLPEGEYRVFVRMRGVLRYQGMVHIEAGRTNWLDIVLN